MAVSFNQVTIAGNLTRTPEAKFLPSGTAVCDVGIAINETYKDRQGSRQERVDFVDVTFFARTAEVAAEYCKQGDPVLVSGKLRLETWEQDGQKRSKLKVVGERLQMLGGKPEQREEPQRSRASVPDVPRHDSGYDDETPF